MRRLAAVLLLGLAACGSDEPPKPPASGAPAPAAGPASEPAAPFAFPPAPPGKPMPKGDPNAATLSLSLNGSTAPVVTRGWPARLDVALDPPSDGAKIELAGPWAWTPTGRGWTLSAEQTAALAPGKHPLKATSGTASIDVEVVVRDEPATLTPVEKALKLARTGEALLRAGKAEEALALAKSAGDRVLEGDALQALGREEEARAAWRKALAEYRKANPKGQPPATILRRLGD